jgi:hypothetical protein
MGQENKESLEEYGVELTLVPGRADAKAMLALIISFLEG